jgi:hypothetical protein
MSHETPQPTATTNASGRSQRDRAAVQDLLDRFARALTSGDGRGAASLWETPAFVLGDEIVMPVASPEEVERFFGGAREQYNSRGITDTRGEIQRLDWVSDRIAIVDVRWPYLGATGKEVGAESSTYVLRKDDTGALRIRAVVMRGVEGEN